MLIRLRVKVILAIDLPRPAYVRIHLGVQPEEVLFVDDNLENVERAASQGLRTIHFKDATMFKKEIKRFVAPVRG
jgi:FMN phosphatase YigB (HAD superfamily)